jgi:hypothetical protein
MCDISMAHMEHDPHSDMRHLHRAEEVRSNPKRMKAVREYMEKVHKGFEAVRGPKHRTKRARKKRY